MSSEVEQRLVNGSSEPSGHQVVSQHKENFNQNTNQNYKIPKQNTDANSAVGGVISKNFKIDMDNKLSKEDQNLATERFIKWRESITEEFQDAMALEGDIIFEWEN